MNLPYVAVIKDSQIVSCTPLEIYSQITWYYITYMKGLCRPLFHVCHIIGGWRKGLEVPSKYNDYCGPTKYHALIRDPTFIFAIMLFSWPLNETRYLYKTDRNSRQYGMYIVCRYVGMYMHAYYACM